VCLLLTATQLQLYVRMYVCMHVCMYELSMLDIVAFIPSRVVTALISRVGDINAIHCRPSSIVKCAVCTYVCTGLSLKDPEDMRHMKADMAGTVWY